MICDPDYVCRECGISTDLHPSPPPRGCFIADRKAEALVNRLADDWKTR